jgi:hypothetical protein
VGYAEREKESEPHGLEKEKEGRGRLGPIRVGNPFLKFQISYKLETTLNYNQIRTSNDFYSQNKT